MPCLTAISYSAYGALSSLSAPYAVMSMGHTVRDAPLMPSPLMTVRLPLEALKSVAGTASAGVGATVLCSFDTLEIVAVSGMLNCVPPFGFQLIMPRHFPPAVSLLYLRVIMSICLYAALASAAHAIAFSLSPASAHVMLCAALNVFTFI